MDNGLNAEVQPGYQSDKGNPFYNSFVADNAGTKTANADYYKANSYAIDYYEYNGDPREARFYTQSPTGFGVFNTVYLQLPKMQHLPYRALELV